MSPSSPDLSTLVGSLTLAGPVVLASGTAGYGDELSSYGDLSTLGAITTKSLAAFEWRGNPAPRVAPAGQSMINAVGLSGPGVAAWRRDFLPGVTATGATVVASIWGRSRDEYADAAEAIVGAPIDALEVNASCPNLESRNAIFANSPEATAELVRAARVVGVPIWVKLTTTAPQLLDVVAAALEAGAEAVTVGNTLTAMVIDVETGRAVLGNRGGGASGEAARPVALRAVYDIRAAFPELPIIGVGGVARTEDALALVMAGANAVGVGTASFADPRSAWRIQRGVARWLQRHHKNSLDDVRGSAHG